MSELFTAALVITGVAAAMAGLPIIALRVRRRGTAGPALGAAMAAYDEAMHSTAFDTFVELRQQDDRTRPLPAPDTPRRP